MNYQAVFSVLLAARMWKNLPLLYLFLAGFAINYTGLHLDDLCLSLWAIVFASVFMTHLNIITDKELDAQSKPDLYKLLSQDARVTTIALVIEFSLCLAGILALLIKSAFYPTACISVFTIVAILYSYNFFTPAHAAQNRLKLYWWGHFGVLLTGYVSLWLGGYFCAIGNKAVLNSTTLWWLLIFVLVSLSEYSLFLLESSIDVKEEQAMQLKTTVALLGSRNTAIAAIVLCSAALAGFMWIAQVAPIGKQLLYIAFLPGILLRLVTEMIILLLRAGKMNYLWKLKAPDIIFNSTRLYTLISILLLK